MSHPLELLSAFLDDELDPTARAGVEAHLGQCPACAARLADFSAVDTLVRKGLVDAPAGYFEALPSRVRTRIRGRRRMRPPVWAWAAAAGVLLAVLTPLTLDKRHPVPMRAPMPAAMPPATSANAFSAPPTDRARDLAATPSPLAGPQAAKALPERQKQKERKDEELRRDDAPRTPPFATTPPVSRPAVVGALAQAPPGRSGPAPAFAASIEPSPAAAPAPAQATADAAPVAGMLDKSLAPAEKKVNTDELATARSRLEEREQAASEADTVSRGQRGATAARHIETPDEGEVSTAEEARRLRESWRAAANHEASPAVADEARVKTIEAGIRAWRLGSDPRDLARAREDARAYLARKDARQSARVRAALKALPSP